MARQALSRVAAPEGGVALAAFASEATEWQPASLVLAAIGRAGQVHLAMVRRQVADTRGRIEIASQPEGGTPATVILPV